MTPKPDESAAPASSEDIARAIAALARPRVDASGDEWPRSSPPPVLTTRDVARLLQVPPSGVTRLVRLGRLRYITGLRGGYLFLLESIVEDLRAHEVVHPVTPAPVRRRGR